tara:strand:+ start:182 stop:634 length:453 start_codon:yes stop_codon:yes gene_type:complete
MISKIDSDVLASLIPESEFAKDIEKHWNVELRKDTKNKYDVIDFMIIKKETDIIEGYVELKNRTISSDQYKTLMIDHKKMIALRIKQEYSGKPVFLAVRYTDKDMIYRINKSDRFHMEHNGRTQKFRNKYDINEVEHIPISFFREIRNKK